MKSRPSATATKALGLLACFDETVGALGLSELARAADLDKTTTLRHAKALVEMGFLEQDSRSKLYHIGAEVLRLARVREQHNPLASILQNAVDRLSQAFGETAHASVMIAGNLTLVATCIGPQQITVQVEQGLRLPFHTTASGLAFLAFSDEAFVEAYLARPLKAVTDRSPTDPDAVRAMLAEFRALGYGRSDSYYCDGVRSFSAPYFDSQGKPKGALTIQIPEPRFESIDEAVLVAKLRKGASEITRALGGVISRDFAHAA